jgi:hypothetical protein
MTAAPPPLPPSGDPNPEQSPPPPVEATAAQTLSPHYGVALAVVILGLAALALQPLWSPAPLLALAISGFGLFLLLQTSLLRLEFSDDALLVRRRDALLRRFPYSEWKGWRLFWPGLPALFYFREERSIHLLPVLFDPAALQSQLRQRLPHLAADAAPQE